MEDREKRLEELEDDVETAERNATESMRIWMVALRKMVLSSPSIGDALLDARDRRADQERFFPIADFVRGKDEEHD